jgi:hypothetical protein
MNIIEVSKKENIGKVYEVFIDGYSKGVWELGWLYGKIEFDLFNEEKKALTFIFSISQILRMEFEEVVDWSKVPVDTPIWVRDNEELDWFPRHFARYEDGKVFAWDEGKTSFTVTSKYESFPWKYAKLYQE